MNEIAWQFEHSIECNVNKSFVWEYWTDVTNWERLEGKAVEWIKLDGPFELGSLGTTKMPGLEPHHWKISQLDPEKSATIDMPLEGAVFHNEISIDALSPDQTRITQRMYLTGTKAAEFAEGMQMFEQTAPQGLAKLAKTIEEAYEHPLTS